jgi:hypothetical protein
MTSGSLFKKDSLNWWVSPVYQQAKTAFKYFKKLFLHTGIVKGKPNESELRVDIVNGSVMEFKSADHPDNLRGEGIDRLVMDECAMTKEETWKEVLRPALIDKKGDACFIGTPKGQNWFHEGYASGLSNDPEIKSFRFPSSTNPFLDPAEIEKARLEMPDRVFRQEMLAEFIDDIGGVFRGVRDCISGDFMQPEEGHSYEMGVDLGKYEDFTVITVIDVKTKHIVAYDRFKDINWSLQEQRILNLAYKYKPHIRIDQGQVGDAILESIAKKYSDIEGVKFTNENKTAMINFLSNLIEKRQITYPEIPEMIEELRIYEYEQLPSGKLRMNAPSGKHDDIVISLALTCWGLYNRVEEIDWNSIGRIEVVTK